MHPSAPLHAFHIVRVAATALLALAAVVAFSNASEAAVFGTDERTRLDTRDAEFAQKIGTLKSADSGSFCTAFCVAPDMIATASHCLFGTSAAAAPKLRGLRFKLGAAALFETGSALAGRAIANQSQHIVSGTNRLAVSPPIGAANDWAVAQLERPLCKAGGLPLTTKSQAEITEAAARGEIYQVAVHADLADEALRRGGPCAPVNSGTAPLSVLRDFEAPDNILLHTCDTGGGSSGSPLLLETANGVEVVALNVGTYIRARSVPTAREADHSSEQGAAIANTAIAIPDLPAAIDALSERTPITTGAGVRRVQELLRNLGYYGGEATARVSGALISAIKEFEATHNLPVRGLLTHDLIANLERSKRNSGAQIMMIAPAGARHARQQKH